MSSKDIGPGGPSPGSPLSQLREITDARTLRALTHPVRIALIEALSNGGAMTATELGEQIGESPTTCSFHLRQLAKYAFVENAGAGKGRARPWRMTSIGMRFTSATMDPETELAAGALMRLVRERQLDRYRTWLETKATYPRDWRDAAGESQWVFYLTAEELKELSDELATLIVTKFRDRLTDPSKRPPGSVPVELLTFAYPMGLPAAAASER
jgi:DNA-binding transcriptional ArsR family regulator